MSFEDLQAELDDSIASKTANEEVVTEEGSNGLLKAITTAATEYINKGNAGSKKHVKKKGKNPSDLTADGSTEDLDEIDDPDNDPAESPVPAGGNYPDTKRYVKKAKDEMFEDEDDDDDKPEFFKKKSKKKVCKSLDEDSDEVDATEFMLQMGNAMDHTVGEVAGLKKSLGQVVKGLAIFGDLLSDLADPRKDQMQETMAKALTYLVKENKELRKSLQESNDLVKSISQAPGMPQMAGIPLAPVGGNDDLIKSQQPAQKVELQKSDRDMLMKAVMQREITQRQYSAALKTGDLSCLKK